MKAALTIAGSDPSGGAGIQADLKTFHQFRVYGEAVITLITVQNTAGVKRVEILPPDLIAQQIEAVITDICPAAAKLGALGSESAVRAVAEAAGHFDFPLVIDPVMISKHGTPLIEEKARMALREMLVPKAFLLTPNLHEAGELTGVPVASVPEMRAAAERLCAMGASAVLVKGGHLPGDSATDILLSGGEFYEYHSPKLETRHTHGTGCTYSAAITAELANGTPLPEAVRIAKQYMMEAIRTAPGLGSGAGPVNHFAGRVDGP